MRKESKEATIIEVVAKQGKETQLADLLSSAGTIVKDTEPQTLQWMGLSNEQKQDTFYVVDFFADENGRKAHFEEVAAALNQSSEELVKAVGKRCRL